MYKGIKKRRETWLPTTSDD